MHFDAVRSRGIEIKITKSHIESLFVCFVNSQNLLYSVMGNLTLFLSILRGL